MPKYPFFIISIIAVGLFSFFTGAMMGISTPQPVKAPIVSQHDDTDPPDGGVSGFVPYTDSLTGCQYLSIEHTGLTPRMNGLGKQVGCK